MLVTMYTSPTWMDKYKAGNLSWGVSEEGKRDYPYMMLQVSVPASEVVGVEQKTVGEGRNKRVFLSYDIVRREVHGIGD